MEQWKKRPLFKFMIQKNILSFISILFFAGLINIFFPLEAQAALAFRSKIHLAVNNTTGATPTEPAGASANDILFMWVLVQATPAPTVTGPTGWTQLYSADTTTNGLAIRLYWIRRGSSAPSYTISWTLGGYAEISVTAWRGAVTSGNPYDVTASNAWTSKNPSNPDCPSVTTTVANTLVIAFGMGWTGWTTVATPPTGYSLAEGGISGNNNDLGVAYISKAAIGVENPSAFSGDAAGLNEVAEVTVALKPFVPPPIRHRVNNY